MAIGQAIQAAATKAAGWVRGLGGRRAAGETGVAYPEVDWAKWGVKPYLADDLLKSKALKLATYRELMRDPVAKAAYYNRVFRILATDWDLLPAGYDRRSRPAEGDPNVETADFLRHCLGRPRLRLPKLVLDLAQGLKDGFAVVEKNYAVIEGGRWDGKIGIAALKAKDVEGWDFAVDEYLNVTGLKQQVLGKWEDRDRSKFLVFSWLPLFENPLGQSEFRAAYRAFWLKDTCLKFRAIYAEALAKGRHKVTYPADQGAAGLKNAKALLDRMADSIGMALPSDLQSEILEQTVAPAGEFKSFVDDCDKEIVIGLEGAALQMLEGAETGAYRATETHGKTSAPWGHVLAVFLEAAIQDDLVQDLTALNFAGREAPDFYFRQSREDLTTLSEVLERLQRMGLKIPAWYVREQFDVPVPEDDDEVLEPAAGAAALPFGPAAGGVLAARPGGAAANLAEPSDPREAAIDRAVARAPAAYRDLVAAFKKKRPLRRARSLTR